MNSAWRPRDWWARRTSWCAARAKVSRTSLFAELARDSGGACREPGARTRGGAARAPRHARRCWASIRSAPPPCSPRSSATSSAGALELFRAGRHPVEQPRGAGARLEGRRRCAARRGRQRRRGCCASSACCPKAPTARQLGIMDIASAQWTLRAHRPLNRIDLACCRASTSRPSAPRLKQPPAAGNAGRRAGGRARSRRHGDPRLSRQSQHAGAGGAAGPARSWCSRRSRCRCCAGAARSACCARSGRRAASSSARCIGEGAALGLAGSIIGVLLGVSVRAGGCCDS